jgi:ATP-dependent DNA helicase RecQ
MEPEEALRSVFGLAEFRPGQRAVVDAVLAGRPTVAVMPTGAGKSLCYQLPAVVAGGTALVVSPLIALMKDQVDALAARGVPACSLTSALAPAEMGARLDDLAEGRLRLVYVAPERFKSPRFEDALARLGGRLSLLAVDEAHCISEWGHDFRPDYLRLGEIIERHRPPRLVALTATATPEVRRDIQRQLGMRDGTVFVRGFDRPNLLFAVERVGGAADKRARLLEAVRRRPGPALVYAATRRNAEAYADELGGAGIRAGAYHAGLADGARAELQDAFMAGAIDVVVATNAFGMGVDKADVRLVVHADLPRSPEAYYQEAGRGGRDGAPATCLLLFNHADVKLQEYLIDAGSPSLDLLRALWRAVRRDPRHGADMTALRRALPGGPGEAAVGAAARFLVRAGYLREEDGVLEALHPSELGVPPAPLDARALAARADIERQKLRAMVDYAYATGCRRRFLLAYFGDEDAARLQRCTACDVCTRAAAPTLDGDDRAQVVAVLDIATRLGGRFGRTRLAGLLAEPDTGALREHGPRYVLDLVRVCEGAGLLAATGGDYPTVDVTPLGRDVLGGVGVALALPARTERARKRKAPPDASGLDADLVERLRRFRREVAGRDALPPYCVFGDRTLEAIARERPTDLAALGDVRGIGPAKLEKYGAAILEITRS